MARITEHLSDRPRDGIFWLDALLAALIYGVGLGVILFALWLLACVMLSAFGS